MKLPQDFVQNIQESFGDEGREWLTRLPKLIEVASERWGLMDVQPVPNLSYNFAAFAVCNAGRVGGGFRYALRATQPAPYRDQGEGDVVLKIGFPNMELTSEMAALRYFNGRGMCLLLDADEEKGMFLLERLQPGLMLAELEDDNQRTHIAIEVMEMFRTNLESGSLLPKPQQQAVGFQRFIRLSNWFDALKEVRVEFDGGTGIFPKEIFERVEASLPELFDDENYLLHGDFHHYNILSSERGWLAIDPKGVIGPAGYEVGPLMLNPWHEPMDGIKFKVQTMNRVDIIKERLGWERKKIIQWALAHAVLSAWWNYPNLDWGYSLNCAKVFSEIK